MTLPPNAVQTPKPLIGDKGESGENRMTTPQPVRAGIAGLGMGLPERVLTNEELAKFVDTNDEWITTRTGIKERRVTDSATATSDLCLIAAKKALADADMDAADLDLVLCATTSGDYIWPATASLIQNALGAKRAGAFDLSAACSGFCYGLATAAGMIQSGAMRNVLVLGADTLTKQLNWNDRGTCVLFGDGAGAAVLTPCGYEEGILGSVLGSDGSGASSIWLEGGGSRNPLTPENMESGLNKLTMNGKEVYRFAVEIVPACVRESLEKVCLRPADVDLLVLHQANVRIMYAIADRLQIPHEKVYVNVQKYGNTSAGTVPIALCEAQQEGRLNRGDVVVTVGYGAGLSWASNVIRWTKGE